MRLSKNIIIVTSWVILIIGIVYINFTPKPRPIPLKKTFIYFPYKIDDWKAREKVNSDYFLTILGADNILVREYIDPFGDRLELYMSYYTYVTEDKTPHAPQLCWVGAGWSFKSIGDEKIQVNGSSSEIMVRKILAEKQENKFLLIYCYKIGDTYTVDMLKFRYLAVLDSIFKRKSNAFTLQLSANVTGRNLESREKVMREFLHETFSMLEKEFLP